MPENLKQILIERIDKERMCLFLRCVWSYMSIYQNQKEDINPPFSEKEMCKVMHIYIKRQEKYRKDFSQHELRKEIKILKKSHINIRINIIEKKIGVFLSRKAMKLRRKYRQIFNYNLRKLSLELTIDAMYHIFLNYLKLYRFVGGVCVC